MKQNIAIISDLHSNYYALNAAISQFANFNIDTVIVLGDLLTYGCHPQETLLLLEKLQQQYPVVFIKGNHDQFYFDRQAGTKSNYLMLDFIEDSVQWHLAKLSENLLAQFNWQESVEFGQIYFSHTLFLIPE